MFSPQCLEGISLSENLKAWITELMENTAYIPLDASGRIDHSLTASDLVLALPKMAAYPCFR